LILAVISAICRLKFRSLSAPRRFCNQFYRTARRAFRRKEQSCRFARTIRDIIRISATFFWLCSLKTFYSRLRLWSFDFLNSRTYMWVFSLFHLISSLFNSFLLNAKHRPHRMSYNFIQMWSTFFAETS